MLTSWKWNKIYACWCIDKVILPVSNLHQVKLLFNGGDLNIARVQNMHDPN